MEQHEGISSDNPVVSPLFTSAAPNLPELVGTPYFNWHPYCSYHRAGGI